jgi:hypothetical protein
LTLCVFSLHPLCQRQRAGTAGAKHPEAELHFVKQSAALQSVQPLEKRLDALQTLRGKAEKTEEKISIFYSNT